MCNESNSLTAVTSHTTWFCDPSVTWLACGVAFALAVPASKQSVDLHKMHEENLPLSQLGTARDRCPEL